MLAIENVQREAYATACEKGWHERPICVPHNGDAVFDVVIDHDRVLAKLALVHTELVEAQDCLDERDFVMRIENDKPEGFVVEIADAVVRLGDLCGALAEFDPVRFQLRCTDLSGYSHTLIETDAASLNRQMLLIHKHVSRAVECARVDNWYDFVFSLNAAVMNMAIICASLGVNLPDAIAAKMNYNKTRPHRHGGKSA